MAPRSAYLWLYLLILFTLAGCTSTIQSPPPTDQKTIATSTDANLNATSTATQPAIPTAIPTGTLSPTQALTLPPPTSTTAPSPTAELPSTMGGLIAYTKNSDVFIWSASNGSTRLTDMHDVESVRISDDGELVAFKRQDPENIVMQELWVVNTQGVPEPRLLAGPQDLEKLLPPDPSSSILGYGVLSYTWRPHTHVLAYNTLVLHEGPGFGPNYDLRLVDAVTAEKATLIAARQGGIFYYSPDGSQVAVANGSSISLLNADGSRWRADVLIFPSVITYSEYEYTPHPVWAVDSSSIRVAIPPEDPLGDPPVMTSLWSIPMDGSPAVLLGSIPAIPFAWPDNAFAPNLERVGFSATASGPDPNQRELHISSPDGSDDVLYDSGESLRFASWSPDSQHFLYKVEGGSNEGFYIGSIGSLPVNLVDDPHSISDIQWLGGSKLVYLIHLGSRWELRLSDLDGNLLALVDTLADSSPGFDVLP